MNVQWRDFLVLSQTLIYYLITKLRESRFVKTIYSEKVRHIIIESQYRRRERGGRLTAAAQKNVEKVESFWWESETWKKFEF